MPGTTPAASQLDWLISSTTTMVLFCSKVIRERLRSSTWVMGHLHRFHTTTTVPDLCRRPHSFWTHFETKAVDGSLGFRSGRARTCQKKLGPMSAGIN